MTWLVTGASRGLGRHLVRQLSASGREVLALARDGARLQALADEATAAGGAAVRPLAIDLADAASIAPRLAEALAGVGHIDGLVNNAGFGTYKPFLDHTERESIDIVQVNLTAAVQMVHAVLPRLLAQRSGHIVNIGSDLARRPLANMAVYAAAKHGLAGFSHSLLREVKAQGIKVSLVNPGIIDTDFGGSTEGSREGAGSLRPEQLARIVMQVIEQPGSTVIDELTVHPLGQDGW